MAKVAAGCKFKSPSTFLGLSRGARWAPVARAGAWVVVISVEKQAELLAKRPWVPGSGLGGEMVKPKKESRPLSSPWASTKSPPKTLIYLQKSVRGN